MNLTVKTSSLLSDKVLGDKLETRKISLQKAGGSHQSSNAISNSGMDIGGRGDNGLLTATNAKNQSLN